MRLKKEFEYETPRLDFEDGLHHSFKIIQYCIDNQYDVLNKVRKKEYFGFIECDIIPPKNLYHPVLPVKSGKLVFDLNEKRGVWTSIEINLAIDKGYKELASKSESYEICFIPDNDYRGFLKRRVEGLEEKVKGGSFITTCGEIVGTHDGYPFYTIGQRKLGVSLGPDPTYVVGINPEENTVIVGTKEDLKKQEMFITNVNYLKYTTIDDGMKCLVKVRYKHKGEMATITNQGKNLKVLFHKQVTGIAPGQSAVIYEGNDLIAGGFIMRK